MEDIIKFVDGKHIIDIRKGTLDPSESDSVSAAEVPGVLLFGNQPLYAIGNHLFPVLGCVRRDGKYLPVLDIPQTDRRTPAEPEEVEE